MVRMASYQQNIVRSYNKNVRVKVFQQGDWVLRKVFPNNKDPRHGNLAPTWEGPYRVERRTGHGAYELTNRDGMPIPRSWNATHLKLPFLTFLGHCTQLYFLDKKPHAGEEHVTIIGSKPTNSRRGTT